MIETRSLRGHMVPFLFIVVSDLPYIFPLCSLYDVIQHAKTTNELPRYCYSILGQS
jgi:hypothetical protein